MRSRVYCKLISPWYWHKAFAVKPFAGLNKAYQIFFNNVFTFFRKIFLQSKRTVYCVDKKIAKKFNKIFEK